MTQRRLTHVLIKLLAFIVFLAQHTAAQGYDIPLTFHGFNQTTLHSAASRAMGGLSIHVRNQAGTMFANPASLQSLTSPQVVFGGFHTAKDADQVQQYSPLKYYSNFSLLMEGLTGYIPDPDTALPGSDAGDSVQRPFDDIGPNWSHKKNTGARVEAFLAAPFSFAGIELVAGLGIVDYANMNHHYENHNVLSPSVGSERPVPIARPASDSSPVIVDWSSFLRSRQGYIRGYGGVLSVALSEQLSFGFSAMVLDGSTDDVEQSIARGRLTFYRDWFRLDSVYGHQSKRGTSEFCGEEYTIGAIYRGKNLSIGFSLKPPMTMTRAYTTQIEVDTTGVPTFQTVESEDEILLPWRGSTGVSLALRDNLVCGVEYEILSYASGGLYDAYGLQSTPWISSSVFHAGVEYTPFPMLALRAGVRERAELFEQEGNPLMGEPVKYSIYSAGCGVTVEGIQVNLAAEYGKMKYQDLWQTNVNFNNESYTTVVLDVVYMLPQLTLK